VLRRDSVVSPKQPRCEVPERVCPTFRAVNVVLF
jgi:hypothetical protein